MTDTVAEVDSAEPEPESTPPQFKPRRVHLWLLIGVPAVVLVVLAGFALSRAMTPPTAATVHGSMTLQVAAFTDTTTVDTGNPADVAGDQCVGADGYTDVASGAEVDIVDGAGKVLAVGNLGDGKVTSDTYGCEFDFTVSSVPKGVPIYGVKVGNASRGVVHFPTAQFWAGPALSLG